MFRLREWLHRLWGTFRKAPHDAALEEELRLHVEMLATELRRRGLPPDEAAREAHLQAGGVAQAMDQRRDQRGLPRIEDLARDVRYAARLALRQPRFSLLIVATMALAVGVSTALFSVADVTVLRPLPYPHAEQLMDAGVGFEMPELHRLFYSTAISDVRRWRTSDALVAAAGYHMAPDVVLDGAVPARVRAREITEGYFGVYGSAPAPGRDFTMADTAAGAPPVVIISHRLWQTEFGGTAAAIGALLRYDDASAEIVGVAPAGFQPDVALWRPVRAGPATIDFRGGVEAVLRVRPHLAVDDIATRLSSMTPVGEWRSAAGGAGALGGPVRLTSELDRAVSRYAAIVRLLGAAVGLIVLIACVNVAGLLFARGATRAGEMAIRTSIGATRARLVRQLLIESLALALAGGVGGVLLGWLSLDALLAILPIRLEPGAAVSINVRVLVAAAVTTTATGVAFGLAPAVRLSRARIGGDLARAGRRLGAALPRRRGQWLVATEIALAVALLAGAGLMTRSFARLLSVDLGFDPGAVVAFNVLPVGTDPGAQTQTYRDLLQTVRAVPGVAHAGAVDLFALGDAGVNKMVTANGRNTAAGVRQVLPGYFEAMGFRLRAGVFPGAAGGIDPASAAVVNESAARTLFGGDAVGGSMVVNTLPLTVAAVVADVHESGPMQEVTPEVFVPFVPLPPGRRSIVGVGLTIVVRPRPGAPDLTPALRAAAASLGPRAIVHEPRRGDAWLSDLVATPRHQTTLVTLLGGFGLALTLIGVFSTTAYAVERRTREIGVRMALGADASSVVATIVRDAGRPLTAGLAGGIVVAYFATHLLQSFLFETTPHDPATFAAAAVLMILAALLAAWLPARRAARVDPVAALRAE